MADLEILEDFGWEELEDLAEATAPGDMQLDVDALWKACGRGDTDAALKALEEAGYEFEDDVEAVKCLVTPDDIGGDVLRVWVQYAEEDEDEEEGPEPEVAPEGATP